MAYTTRPAVGVSEAPTKLYELREAAKGLSTDRGTD